MSEKPGQRVARVVCTREGAEQCVGSAAPLPMGAALAAHTPQVAAVLVQYTPVQALWSSMSTGVCTQPVAGLHESSVQALLSLHTTGVLVPVQTPLPSQMPKVSARAWGQGARWGQCQVNNSLAATRAPIASAALACLAQRTRVLDP